MPTIEIIGEVIREIICIVSIAFCFCVFGAFVWAMGVAIGGY